MMTFVAKTYKTPEWLYQTVKGIFRGILKLTYDVKTVDTEKLLDLAPDQGFIMASNHGSIVDAFVMGLMVDSHRVRFIGRQRTLWANPVFGRINDIVGTIPVPESKTKDKSIVIETAVKALRSGAAIGIFPEGAILARRKNYEGRTGMARMVLEAGVPVVPIGLYGTDGLWPYGAKMPRLGRPVEMHVGDTMYFDEYHDMHENRQVVKYVTDLVMKEVRKKSGWYDVPNEEIVRMYKYYENLEKPDA